MDKPIEGGCLCAAIRYRITGAPLASSLCHCRSCQLASGATRVAWVVVARSAFEFAQGRPAEFQSSPGVTRSFCARCGTPLTYRRADSPDSLDITTASLDHPEQFPPTREIWLEHKLAWEPTNPALQLHAQDSTGQANETVPDEPNEPAVSVAYTDLEGALEFASFNGPYEASAFVDLQTGRVHLVSPDIEIDEEPAPDFDDSTRYRRVPDKKELDLGRKLVLDFVDEALPKDYDRVAGYFHKRGAYSRFKDLLHNRGVVEDWYAFERQATEKALREWCRENGIALSSAPKPGS